MKKLKRLFVDKVSLKKFYSRQIFSFAAAGAGFVTLGSQARAQTIIYDNFTSGSHYGTSIDQQTGNSAGLAPSTDIASPGQNWQHITGAWYDSTEYSNTGSSSNYFFTQNNAEFHNNPAVGLSLGSYNTGSVVLSAYVGFNNGSSPIGEYQIYNPITNSYSNAYDPTRAFALLGFSSSLNTASNYGPDARNTFTGLALIGDGSLQEYVAGAPIGSPEAYTGTFSAYLPLSNKLTFTINTATGAISNVSLGSSTTAYSFGISSAFLNADTANLEIGGTAGGGADTAVFSSLDLSSPPVSAPEPSVYGLLGVGALGLGALGYRRRMQLRA